jgi:hypothetical protein
MGRHPRGVTMTCSKTGGLRTSPAAGRGALFGVVTAASTAGRHASDCTDACAVLLGRVGARNCQHRTACTGGPAHPSRLTGDAVRRHRLGVITSSQCRGFIAMVAFYMMFRGAIDIATALAAGTTAGWRFLVVGLLELQLGCCAAALCPASIFMPLAAVLAAASLRKADSHRERFS